MIKEIGISDYLRERSENDILVDLRSKTMYELGTIRGAINIPPENVKEL